VSRNEEKKYAGCRLLAQPVFFNFQRVFHYNELDYQEEKAR